MRFFLFTHTHAITHTVTHCHTLPHTHTHVHTLPHTHTHVHTDIYIVHAYFHTQTHTHRHIHRHRHIHCVMDVNCHFLQKKKNDKNVALLLLPHTVTHTHTDTQTYCHTYTPRHTDIHTDVSSNRFALLVLPHTVTHTHTYTHRHTDILSHIHTQTHRHTQWCFLQKSCTPTPLYLLTHWICIYISINIFIYTPLLKWWRPDLVRMGSRPPLIKTPPSFLEKSCTPTLLYLRTHWIWICIWEWGLDPP